MSSVAVLTHFVPLPSLWRYQAVHAREMSEKGRVRTLKVYIYSNPENGGAQHDTTKQPRRDSPLCSCSNITAQLIVYLAS